jgi:hypothetical protein
MFPAYPMSQTVGALWMTVDSTTEQFPTNGSGGSTTTEASSTVRLAQKCVIEGITLLTAGTATTLTLTNGLTGGAAATVDVFTIPVTGQEGMLAAFGIEGLERPGPFGAKLTSGTGTCILWYRVIFGAPTAP